MMNRYPAIAMLVAATNLTAFTGCSESSPDFDDEDELGSSESMLSVRTGTSSAGAFQPLTAPLRFNPLASPIRIYDSGTTLPAGTVSVPVAGAVGANAQAVMVRATAIAPTLAGRFSIFNPGPRPATSSLSFGVGATTTNAAVTKITQGAFSLYSTGGARATAEVTGWFGATGAGFVPRTPRRVLDTRTAAVPLVAGQVRSVAVGMPTDATAVSASVIAIRPGAAGSLTVFPCGSQPGALPTVSFTAGATQATAVLSKIGTSGAICLVSSVSLHVTVDVNGYFAPNQGAGFVATQPTRILDTRNGTGEWSGKLGAGQTVALSLRNVTDFPADANAVVLNATAINAGGSGYVTIYSCGTVPNISRLQTRSGQATAALLNTPISADGRICIFSSIQTDLAIDLLGAYRKLSACMDTAQCATGLTCQSGYCAAPPCASNMDCAIGQSCSSTTRLCVRQACASNTDCATGAFCQSGFCAARACTSTEECSSGQICSSTTHLCVRPACEDDADCAAGQVCSSTTRLCVQQACEDDADCAAGRVCSATAGVCL